MSMDSLRRASLSASSVWMLHRLLHFISDRVPFLYPRLGRALGFHQEPAAPTLNCFHAVTYQLAADGQF